MVEQFTMRTYGVNRAFDLLKAFCYIERAVKSDFFWKRPNFRHTCATCSEPSFYISTIVLIKKI